MCFDLVGYFFLKLWKIDISGNLKNGLNADSSDPFNARNPRLLFSTTKNHQRQEGDQNAEHRTRYGKPE